MERWFGRRLLRHYRDEQTNLMPPRHRLSRGLLRREAGVCVYGHFNRKRGFGVWDYYPGIGQFVTILRDPFEMAVSNYFYARRLGENRYWKGQTESYPYDSLSDYLNRMEHSFYLNYFAIELTEHNWREHLDEHFVWIGVTEHLQDSLDIIASRLGKRPVRVPVINVSPRNEEVTDEMRQRFRDNHTLEYRVYEYALQLHSSYTGDVNCDPSETQ